MKESLDKKMELLDKIIVQNHLQEELLKAEEMDYDAFDETVERKTEYIDSINSLDRGFQAVYDRINILLKENKGEYAADIKAMQDKIKQITDKSVDIRAQEARNKDAFQERVRFTKKAIKVSKDANRVAADYYQSMNKLNVVESQFLDTKK